MKICVSAAAGDMDAQIDWRFGRCPFFVIVEPDTMTFEALDIIKASIPRRIKEEALMLESRAKSLRQELEQIENRLSMIKEER